MVAVNRGIMETLNSQGYPAPSVRSQPTPTYAVRGRETLSRRVYPTPSVGSQPTLTYVVRGRETTLSRQDYPVPSIGSQPMPTYAVRGGETPSRQDYPDPLAGSQPAMPHAVKDSVVENNASIIDSLSEARLDQLISQVELYFTVSDRSQEIKDIIQEAYRANDTDYGLKEAIEWAQGFTIPEEAIKHDYGLLRAAGLDFDRMVARRFKQLLSSRLNKDRINEVISADNPDRDRLYDLANGMQVPVPDGFIPNGQSERPKMRHRYKMAHTAVNKMNHDIWKDSLAFYLPLSIAKQLVPGCHLSPAHWTQKKDKASGRPLVDQADDSIPNATLNSPEIRDRATELWGAITHPTIIDIIKMIMGFYERAFAFDPTVSWDNIVIWKMDLKGAYTLLSFRPECAKLFGVEVTNDKHTTEGQYAIFFLCGVFGWTGTPYAFQVVTRSILHELRKSTCGDVTMYVDDLIGVCLRGDYNYEKENAYKLCTALLGPTAIAEHKTEVGRRLDVIGYTIDLDTRLVTISKKNFLKTLHGYYDVDLSKPVPRATIEKLASWGSRYAFICRFMKPFNRALYSALPTQRHRLSSQYNPHVSQVLPPSAQRAVRLWRAMLCALRLDERKFSRSFDLFKGAAAEMICEFDSSLTGSGMLFYKCNQDGSETIVGGAAVSLASLGFNDDSSYQNTSEFIAVVLSLRVLRTIFPDVTAISLRGDSVSALTWASKGQFRGDLVTNASILYTLILIVTGIEIVGEPVDFHLKGEDNWRCDGLSRGKVMSDIGMNHVAFMDLNKDPLSLELLSLCDPAAPIEKDDDFASFFRRCNAAISNLSSRLYCEI